MNSKEFTLYTCSYRGNAKNTSYPTKTTISSLDDLTKAASSDHVGCCFSDGKNNRGTLVKAYRSNKCFQSADVIIMDCDNTSERGGEFKTPEDVANAFRGVEFYTVYSRNHMKEMDGLSARPRFHVYFPLRSTITDLKQLEQLKKSVLERFKWFDPNAIKTTQPMFGVEKPVVRFFEGERCVDENLEGIISEGHRNETLSKLAGKIITRHGDTDKALQEFLKVAERCDPPLTSDEIWGIWRSAQSFFKEKVETTPGYMDPMDYEFSGGKKKGFTTSDLKKILHRMGITVRTNEITGLAEVEGMPPQYSKGNAFNVLPTLIEDFALENRIKCQSRRIVDGLLAIMDENRYNPLQQLLTSKEWDGKDRINELIEEIMGIEESERFLVRKWLHQCVAMALNDEKAPYGADGVLVLQGEQGIGKTLLCSKLAIRPDWFAEGVSIDMGNKDTIIQSTCVWIAELGELDSTLKREQSALKAFLTAKQDTYRVPYGRSAITRPRRTSFCATVNPETFLNDETGSKRFWVVRPHIDLAKLLDLDEEWLTQLWIQVYQELFLKAPQGFRLTKEEQKNLQKRNEIYTKPIPGEVEILDKLNFDLPVEKWTWTTASRVAELVRSTHISTIQAGRAISKLAKMDSRIQMRVYHHSNQYFLPPLRDVDYYPMDSDDMPPLIA